MNFLNSLCNQRLGLSKIVVLMHRTFMNKECFKVSLYLNSQAYRQTSAPTNLRFCEIFNFMEFRMECRMKGTENGYLLESWIVTF